MDLKKNVKMFGWLCQKPRSEKELEFLSQLFVKSDELWPKVVNNLPDSITVESLLESQTKMAEKSARELYGNTKVNHARISGLVVPQLELMSLLPETHYQLFMLYPTILNHFNPPERISWQFAVLKPFIETAFESMKFMLEKPQHSWGAKIQCNRCVREDSGKLSKIAFIERDQDRIMDMFEPLGLFRGEGTLLKLAGLLVEADIINEYGFNARRAKLQERFDFLDPHQLPVIDPEDDPILRLFATARIQQIGSVEVLDTYLAKKTA